MVRSFRALALSLFLLVVGVQPAAGQVSVWVDASPDPFDVEQLIEARVDAWWSWEYFGCDWEFTCEATVADVTFYSSSGIFESFQENIYFGCCYRNWTFYDDVPGLTMEPASYHANVTIWYFNSDWGIWYSDYNYDDDDVQPAAPTITGGPNTIWYFSGASPANYPIQATLYSSAGPNTTWQVIQGGGLITLEAFGGAAII